MNIEIFLALLGMAIATYFTRVGGFWMLNKVILSQRLERCLNYLPGTILTSLVAPIVASGDASELVAIIGTLVVGIVTRNVLLSMSVGILLVLFVRSL